MCFIYDGFNELETLRYPKARKEHKCHECWEPIAKGEVYVHFRALFDGAFSTTKMCRRCEYLRHEISKAEIKSGCSYSESWCPTGELKEALREYGMTFIAKDQVPQEFQLKP